jgi:formylglycine-generating enzyme required for sulfatase activity
MEYPTIENALGMKFVPVKMTLPGQPDDVIYVQQAEVTYEQYRKFKVAAGLATTEAERTSSDQPLAPNDFDSWEDASQFIDRLNQWDTEHAYRMPTEYGWSAECPREPTVPTAPASRAITVFRLQSASKLPT